MSSIDTDKRPSPPASHSGRQQAESHTADCELDMAAVRRLDWTVLPLCAIVYLLNFLGLSPSRKGTSIIAFPCLFLTSLVPKTESPASQKTYT
ncbi:hypothetical protein JCM10296v2_004637 [Rhodotorula toruloides]